MPGTREVAESPSCTRRAALGGLAALVAGSLREARAFEAGAALNIATFSADVTIPKGHPCMGGGIAPARAVLDPLLARGVVLFGREPPVVVAAVDWCEIRNEAYDRWRSALAEAAGTVPSRVLVSSVHQHDAPVADLEAERLLRECQAQGSICDPDFHERAVRRTADALREGLTHARPFTHVGVGSARVEKVGSNRRYLNPDGSPNFGRTSASRDAYAREQPEGTIDPLLRALSFWDGETPIAALNVYSTHPMSRYGQGLVSADFVGDARRQRQEETPTVFQIYFSGCSGNVTAGKYNDGAPPNRAVLAGRLHDAMTRAWKATERHPVDTIGFRTVPLRLEPRDGPGFTVDDLTRRLKTDPKPFNQCLAAMGLSWRKRADAGHVIELPRLDLGPALVVLFPGESYVEYQRLAQSLRPDRFVVALGYGESATGYVPTERAVNENDSNLHDWCWVAPGAETALTRALKTLLDRPE